MKRRFLFVTAFFAQIVLVQYGLPSVARADAGRRQIRSAPRLVSAALRHEIDGRDAERDATLRKAVEKHPKYAPARWHQGYVRLGKRWVKYDAPSTEALPLKLAEYRRLRETFSETAQGRMKLADWCGKNGFPAQRRAHLTEVLRLDPDYAQAHKALGHQQVKGQWVTPEQIAKANSEAKELDRAFRRWRPKLIAIRNNLASPSKARRRGAEDRLMAVNDPSAIVPIQCFFSLESEESAQVMLRAFAAMPSAEASVALARQAVFSPSETVRATACKLLKSRDKATYVPVLLRSFRSMLPLNTAAVPDGAGRLTYGRRLVPEGQDENAMLVFDTPYASTMLRVTDRSTATLARAQLARARSREITQPGRALETEAQRQQRAMQSFNARLCEVLETTTGEDLPATPQSWSEWWAEYNHMAPALATLGELPVSRRFWARHWARFPNISLTEAEKQLARLPESWWRGWARRGVSTTEAKSLVARMSQPISLMSCFVEGTEVWTFTGSKVIEKLEVGDLVLSQHPETGELAYKSVLQTTTRDQAPLIWVETKGDPIHCTRGHPFWVNGEGWVRACDLKPGMTLHTVKGGIDVVSIESLDSAETYNLVVADFHTYFVRESMFLSHDNTMPEPVSAILPGLTVEGTVAGK
jgi:hypothetical protein